MWEGTILGKDPLFYDIYSPNEFYQNQSTFKKVHTNF